MEPSTISATNTAPEIGALYAEAIPAAAPQPTSNRSRGVVHRCKLHKRTFTPDGSPRGDGEKCGKRFHQTLARGNFAIAQDDCFHVIGGGDLPVESRTEVDDYASQETADRRDYQPSPHRHFAE